MAKLINTDHFPGQVRICDDVATEYTKIVIEHIRDCLTDSDPNAKPISDLAFAISGGSSGKVCLETLLASKSTLLEQVEWLLVDERCVDKTHPDSNYNMISSIIKQNGLPENHLYDLDCDNEGYYEEILLSKKLEIIQLGFGPDGHCASLFPNSQALNTDPQQLIAKNIDPSGKNRHPRITMTLAAIAKFRLALICVIGEEKREAVHQISEGQTLPAAMVKANNVIWLIDKRAI
jgi:6-phosphogluconolactonase